MLMCQQFFLSFLQTQYSSIFNALMYNYLNCV